MKAFWSEPHVDQKSKMRIVIQNQKGRNIKLD